MIPAASMSWKRTRRVSVKRGGSRDLSSSSLNGWGMAEAYQDRARFEWACGPCSRRFLSRPPTRLRVTLAPVKASLSGVLVLAAGLAACGEQAPAAGTAASPAPTISARATLVAPAAVATSGAQQPVAPPGGAVSAPDPNPLKLPPRHV